MSSTQNVQGTLKSKKIQFMIKKGNTKIRYKDGLDIGMIGSFKLVRSKC